MHRRTHAGAARIGEQIEHGSAARLLAHEPPPCAQIEEEPRILPAMPATDEVLHAELATGELSQSLLARAMPILERLARSLAAVVVDELELERQPRPQVRLERSDIPLLERCSKRLHQHERSVAIDGQPLDPLRDAVEQTDRRRSPRRAGAR